MFQFKNFKYIMKENIIQLDQLWDFTGLDSGFVQVQVAGENKNSHMAAKMVSSSEGDRFQYVNHTMAGHTLTVR